ncbi:MAG: monovalent cation/H(+) antiporter subunit G [Actinomycetota bacterium]|nr:monovalent cation/H(+) antiporter subunit G [Actinomycetota bacterium]
MIGELLILIGSLLTLVAAVGMFRFDDVFARMHALAKASTAGVLLVLTGAAISLTHPNDVTSLMLAAALQVLTSPLATNMLSLTTYRAEGIHMTLHSIDDLGDDLGDHVSTAVEFTDHPDEADH